jgi:outer membrane protein OmpA-like peptidoglycan-associated protein
MKTSIIPRTALFALAAVTFGTLTACQSRAAGTAQETDCPIPPAVVIDVSAHPNSEPGIPVEGMCIVNKALENGKPISIIREDGQPSIVQGRRIYDVKTAGSAISQEKLKKARNSIITTVAGIEAAADGDNTLAALSIAGDLTADTPDAVVIVLSPGLSDQPPLDLTIPGLATASPAEVAAQVKKNKYTPHLEGRVVLWFGLGQASGSQQQLPQPQRENYQNIYAAILSEAGAKTTFHPFGASGNPAANSAGHTIRPVEPLNTTIVNPPAANKTQTFNNASAFGFLPDSTTFRAPAAAAAAAAQIAAGLKNESSLRVTVTGTTASAGTEDSRGKLSFERARAVIAAIGAAGVDTSRLDPVGAGNVFPGFEQDMVDGVLDPVKGDANRSVRLSYQN